MHRDSNVIMYAVSVSAVSPPENNKETVDGDCSPTGVFLLLSLFFLTRNCLQNEVWGNGEIKPQFHLITYNFWRGSRFVGEGIR